LISSYFAAKLDSPIVYIKRIKSKHNVIRDVTRYILDPLAHAACDQHKGNRIHTSRGFLLDKDPAPDETDTEGWEWTYQREPACEVLWKLMQSPWFTGCFETYSGALVLEFAAGRRNLSSSRDELRINHAQYDGGDRDGPAAAADGQAGRREPSPVRRPLASARR